MNPDDPRITAYALGELDAADRAQYEAFLEEVPEARMEVAEIRNVASQLREELQAEPAEGLREEQRDRLFAALKQREIPSLDNMVGQGSLPMWRRASVWSALAACLLVGVFIGLFFPAVLRHQDLASRPVAHASKAPRDGFVFRMAETPDASSAPTELPSPLPGTRESLELKAFPHTKPLIASVPSEPTYVYNTSPAPLEVKPLSTPLVASALPEPSLPASVAPERVVAENPSEPRVKNRKLAVGPDREVKNVVATRPMTLSAFHDPNEPSRPLDSERPFVAVARAPLASLPLHSETSSYATVQRFLKARATPPKNVVRLEELVNAIPDEDLSNVRKEGLFSAKLEVGSCPWNEENRLVRIWLKADGSTLTGVVAKEASAQVEFNPALVSGYRLIGFDDAQRAGVRAGSDIQGGQTIVALYEVMPVSRLAKPLKYHLVNFEEPRAEVSELMTVSLSYRVPASGANRSSQFALNNSAAAWKDCSADFKFSAAVATFGMLLSESPYRGTASWDLVTRLAAKGHDRDGLRAGFLRLVELARTATR